MKHSFKDFRNYMVLDCGTIETEDGAVHCCECDEPIYESDFPNHDWSECPCCGSFIVEEE